MQYSLRIRTVSLVLLLATSACATVSEGVTQRVSIDTAPEGATCILRSNENVVGVIPATPGAIQVDKSKYDIVVECSKEGYIKSKMKNHADVAASSLGNMAMVQYSFIGNTIDSMTGASNKYNDHMFIALDVDKDYQLAKLQSQVPAILSADAAHQAVPVAPVAEKNITTASAVEALNTSANSTVTMPLPAQAAGAQPQVIQIVMPPQVNAQQAVAEVLPQVLATPPNLNVVEMTARQPTIEVAQASEIPGSIIDFNAQPAHDATR